MGRHYEKAIISAVTDISEGFAEAMRQTSNFMHILTCKSILPFAIDYDTPATLGTDRLAAIAGAYNETGNANILVIDAGTAITYDLLINGKYCGGAISPGISMRFKALHYFTGRLPLVEAGTCYQFPAKSTLEGIKCGVINGVVFEINKYICQFEEKFTDPAVIITGGDCRFLAEKTDSRHIIEPDLVMKGLNIILEYNAKKHP